MYIDFILIEDPPDVQELKKIVMLGAVTDGCFIVPSFPTTIRFGGYLEVAFEGDEGGLFEVEIKAEELETGDERAVHNKVLEIPPADPDWPLARVHVVPFEVELTAEAEADFALNVYVERKFEGERAVVIRQAPVP